MEKIDLVKISNIARVITPNTNIRLSTNPKQKLSYLSEKYPYEKKGIKNYFAEMRSIVDELESLKTKKDRKNYT